MERRETQIFLTLAEELHFGRTAEKLYVSQARVSQTIKKLERQYGVLLFHRTSRCVTLTPIGAALHEEVRAGYERIQRGIATAIAAGRDVRGTLTIGLEAPAVAELAASVFDRFRARHPEVDLVFRESGFGDPLDLLRAREVDLAVTNAPAPGEADHDIAWGPALYQEPVVLAVSTRHRLARRATVTVTDLDDEIVLRAGRRAAPYRREPDRTAATLLELLAMVASGAGICPLAAHAATYFARPSLAMIPFTADSPPVNWVLAWRAGERTARIDALLDFLAAPQVQALPKAPMPICRSANDQARKTLV